MRVAKPIAAPSLFEIAKNSENFCGLVRTGSGIGLSTAGKIVLSLDRT
jgi:hypothetical protein